MTTFYADDDAIWAKDQVIIPDERGPVVVGDVLVLRRCDLAPDRRRFWAELVERVTGSSAGGDPNAVGWRYDGSCRDCQANLDTNGGQHQFWCGTVEGKAQWPADDWEIR